MGNPSVILKYILKQIIILIHLQDCHFVLGEKQVKLDQTEKRISINLLSTFVRTQQINVDKKSSDLEQYFFLFSDTFSMQKKSFLELL
jgi:hypothetical protein